MYDIILIHDLDVYELGVRGELCGFDAGADLARCLSCLTGAASVVVDLTGVARLDGVVALALARAIAALAGNDVAVACAVTSAEVRFALHRASVHVHAVVRDDVDGARLAARRRLAA